MNRRAFLKAAAAASIGAGIAVTSALPARAEGLLKLDVDFHPRQMQAYKALSEPGDIAVCYGGAKGGGKSHVGCKYVLLTSLDLIKKYGLKPSQTPLLIGFMGRKRNSDFVKTTLETWKKEIPHNLYRINEAKQEIIILDTVKWHYGGFDDRALIEKFNSAEYCRVFVDQAEEITEREYAMLVGTLRLKIAGYTPYFKQLLTCNPAQVWLKREFVRNPKLAELGRKFIPALPRDNPFLAGGYVERLRHTYRNQPELLEAYIEGSWDAIAAENQLIRDVWIRKSTEQQYDFPKKRRIISVDVARFGLDRTVIGYGLETDLQEVEIYGKKDTYYTQNRIEKLAIKHSLDGTAKTAPLIVIDADGLGGPVADQLLPLGYRVLQINSAGESSDQNTFYNLRAEMWWNGSMMYSDGDVYQSYGDMTQDDIDDLEMELTVMGYTLKHGRILVDSKDDIKDPRRYGRSPDVADMYIMLLYGLQFVQPDVIADRIGAVRNRNLERPLSPMA